MKLDTKTHIALGQTSLLVTLLLVAVTLGLIPDRLSAIREGRVALAESVAANSSAMITRDDTRRLQAILKLVVERNDDLLSAGLRREGGQAVVTVADHSSQWKPEFGEHSTDSQLSVPIWAGSEQWGRVELRFRPLTRAGWLAVLDLDWLRLIVFMGLAAFVSFYLYLGRTLRHLDPNRAVPPHVRAALDTLAEGLLILDLRGNIVLSNSAFAQVAGETSEKLLGRSASELSWTDSKGAPVPPEQLPWEIALQEGVAQRNDPIQMRAHDARVLSFQVNCSPVLGPEGKHGGVLITFEDVTELEESKRDLHKSKEEADSANRAKSDFLANMSHEIRTPMNAILGFTEVLRRGFAKSEVDRKRHLNTIHSSGKHLLQLINDVLDLSKVEAGRLDVEQIELVPHVLIRDVVKVLAVKAEEKKISLEFDVVGEVPETIQSDPTRVRQIMTNLIGNALKFTDRGGVKVVLQLASANETDRLVIDVIDTGVGMQQDKLESIFEAFVQADSSVTRHFGGTGLGLAISRRFARALGGDIVVRSEVGKGSVFTVMIDPGPLDKVKLIDAQTALSAEEALGTEQKGRWQFPSARVLVVDDGEENRELLKIVLGDVGLHVEEAENGQVGARKAMSTAFDVILMDMQMPVMNGREATKLLRQQGLSMPIIALTANAMKGFEKECIEVGCTGYLTKPLDVDELVHTVAKILGGQLIRGDEDGAAIISEPSGETATCAIPGTGGNVGEGIQSQIPSRDARLQRIRKNFTKRLGEQMDAIERAWGERDFSELAALGHWLKGSAGTVGYTEFTEPARKLELLAQCGDESGLETIVPILRRLTSGVMERTDVAPGKSPAAGISPISTGTSGADVSRRVAAPQISYVDPRLQRIRSRFSVRLQEQLATMEAAWERRDYDKLSGFAHWLKGSAGTLGFSDFSGPSESLEMLSKAKDEDAIARDLHTIRRLADGILVADKDQRTQETVT